MYVCECCVCMSVGGWVGGYYWCYDGCVIGVTYELRAIMLWAALLGGTGAVTYWYYSLQLFY